jgi:DnaJ-domain-containing protein 1
MSSLKDRLLRNVRANLNELLDHVREFEDSGGFQQFVETVREAREEYAEGSKPGETGSDDKTIREYYANLEVDFGADMDTVKESYHRLMEKYHPDRFADDPEMQKKATELSQELTRAYEAVKRFKEKGRY